MEQKLHADYKRLLMELPKDFQSEILPYLDESEPTPKEEVICRVLENAWHQANVKSILNYLFSIPAQLFFKEGNQVRFV